MNYIKIFNITPKKQEIMHISHMLRKPQNEVLGALVRLWCWMDEHTEDGDTELLASDIDAIAGLSGLCNAMDVEGWVERDVRDCIVIRNPWTTSKRRRARCRANAQAKAARKAFNACGLHAAASPRMSADTEELAREIEDNPELVEACADMMKGGA